MESHRRIGERMLERERARLEAIENTIRCLKRGPRQLSQLLSLSNRSNARRSLRAACTRAGISPVSHNDFRRTFASWLAEEGVPELVTASLLGHASSAMVRRVYSRIGPAAQLQAIETLPDLGTVTDGVTDLAPKGGLSGRYGQTKSPDNQRSSGLVVPRDRIELSTRGFSVRCSTD